MNTYQLGRRYKHTKTDKVVVLHDVVDGYPVLDWQESGRRTTKHPRSFWQEFRLYEEAPHE